MSAVRVRIYEDHLGMIRVEVDGRPVVPETTIGARCDDGTDVIGFVRSVIRLLIETVPLDNVEVR